MTRVTEDDGECSMRVSGTVTHSVHASIAAAAVCDALSRLVTPALAWNARISRADAIVELSNILGRQSQPCVFAKGT